MQGVHVRELYAPIGLSLHERLVEWGLVPKEGEYLCPNCGTYLLKLSACSRSDEGIRWVCYGSLRHPKRKARKCDTRVSYRRGTFFSGSHLSVGDILQFVCLWVQNAPLTCIQTQLQISCTTACDWASFCREVVCFAMYENRQILGGPGVTVEIDESKFRQNKYHRGKRMDGQWVFGGYERGTGRVFLVAVERRDSETLMPLIREWIRPGTTVISNCWKAYEGLTREGYEHLTVNHSLTFKDPDSGAHTNSIEGTWRAAKLVVSHPGQRVRSHVPGNLAKYMFFKRCRELKVDRAREFFRLAGELYNPLSPKDSSTLPRHPPYAASSAEAGCSSDPEGVPPSGDGPDEDPGSYVPDNDDLDLFIRPG